MNHIDSLEPRRFLSISGTLAESIDTGTTYEYRVKSYSGNLGATWATVKVTV